MRRRPTGSAARRQPACRIRRMSVTRPRTRRLAIGIVIVLAAAAQPLAVRVQQASAGPWTQWGGPTRDFVVRADRLADSWPEGGPPVLWSRPLGTGHSAIVADEGRLFTMYRAGNGRAQQGPWDAEEAVVALDALTGRTLWEHKYPSRREDFSFGAGPHSTPLVVGDRVFTIGTNQQLFAFDKQTGEVLWSHDLIAEFGSPELLIRPVVKVGYGCSPDRVHRHDHLQRRRPRAVGDGVPAGGRRGGVEERRLPDLGSGPHPDRRRGDASRWSSWPAGRSSGLDPATGRGAVGAPARSGQRPQLRHASLGSATTSCSSRPRTRPAAAPFA